MKLGDKLYIGVQVSDTGTPTVSLNGDNFKIVSALEVGAA